MARLTRSGVAHYIEESPHKKEVVYNENDKLTFVFSSELYLTIFTRKLEENRVKINESLSKRFGFNIEQNKIADIKLYSMTEKRGFYIIGKEEHKCQSTIRLIGDNLMNKS